MFVQAQGAHQIATLKTAARWLAAASRLSLRTKTYLLQLDGWTDATAVAARHVDVSI